MSLFSKLFGHGSKKAESPFPTRPLNLVYEIIPENGQKFAKQFSEIFQKVEGIELDYSPASISLVDNMLQTRRSEGLSVDQFAETIFTAGCYVGQVIVNNNPSKWIREEDANLPEGISMSSIVIKIGDTVCDPIAKAYKFFFNGSIDSLEYFYFVFTKDAAS